MNKPVRHNEPPLAETAPCSGQFKDTNLMINSLTRVNYATPGRLKLSRHSPVEQRLFVVTFRGSLVVES